MTVGENKNVFVVNALGLSWYLTYDNGYLGYFPEKLKSYKNWAMPE